MAEIKLEPFLAPYDKTCIIHVIGISEFHSHAGIIIATVGIGNHHENEFAYSVQVIKWM